MGGTCDERAAVEARRGKCGWAHVPVRNARAARYGARWGRAAAETHAVGQLGPGVVAPSSEFAAATMGGLATTRCGTSTSRWSGRAERRTLRSTLQLSARPSCAGLRLSTPARDGRC
eukprot:12919049-Alexandrium_andersonii.AAC.1